MKILPVLFFISIIMQNVSFIFYIVTFFVKLSISMIIRNNKVFLMEEWQ